MSEQKARIAARECIQMVQFAIASGALPATINGEYPCEARNVYLPGSDYPDITRHDYQALFGSVDSPGNAAWIQLHYVSQSDRIASGLSRNWAASQPACAGMVGGTTGQACDEYPFFSSAESGSGASLAPLSSPQNSGAGGRYGVFVRGCKLTSGGPVAATQAANGTPFLVLPMDFTGAPATLQFCKQ